MEIFLSICLGKSRSWPQSH